MTLSDTLLLIVYLTLPTNLFFIISHYRDLHLDEFRPWFVSHKFWMWYSVFAWNLSMLVIFISTVFGQ